MKKSKKLISLAISAVMCAGMAVPVNAAAGTGEVFVSHFDDFSGWTSVKGAVDDLPDGFFALDGGFHPERATATGSVTDDNYAESRLFKLGNGAMVCYQFDNVYKTGKRRVSFDLKFNEVPTGKFFISGHENNGNDNPYDYWQAEPTNGTDVKWDYIPYVNIEGGTFKALRPDWSLGAEWTGGNFNDGCLHKIEMVFDYDNDTITSYVDGTEVYTGKRSQANKTFYFTNESGVDVYIDNFAVYHGSDPSYADGCRMVKETYNRGLVPLTGGNVLVNMSRAITDVSETDFTVKDSDGNVVSNAVVYASKWGGATVQVDLNTLPKAGMYTLEYSGAVNSVNFIAGEDVTIDNVDTAPYYYMNEDFGSYAGGVPAQWQATVNSSTTTKPTAGTDAAKGTTLKMPKGVVSSYMNKFGESFKSGKLKVEFDMKASGKGWGVGFIREADWQDTDYEQHLAIGNISGADGDIYTSGLGEKMLSQKMEDAAISNSDWNHVSITVNMTNDRYYFDVNGKKADVSQPLHEYGRWDVCWYDVVKSTDTTLTGADAYKCGLNGIRLYSDGTSDVEFDNVKIYAENSDYISEDFNDWGANRSGNNVPAGYYRMQDLYNPNSLAPAEGSGGTEKTGAAVKNTEQIRLGLTHPINNLKKTKFAVEFDVKPNETVKNSLKFALYPKEKFYGQKQNGDSSTCLHGQGVYQDPIIAMGNMGVPGKVIYHSGPWGEGTAPMTADGQTLDFEWGRWNHIKLIFDPTNGMTITLTKPNGTVLESTTIPTSSVINYNKLCNDYNNIYGIGLNVDKSMTSTAEGDTPIDNLKVYELGTVTKPSVVSVNVIGIDDESTVLSNDITEVSTATKAVEVNFTSPVDETDETIAQKITLTDSNGVAVASGTLSSDKTKYTLNINQAPADGSYATLKTSYTISGTSSVAQISDAVSKTLKFVSPAGERGVKIDSMRLMKKIAGRQIGTSRQSPDAWVRAESRNDADAAEYKVYITGTNATGEADSTTYNYINAVYGDDRGIEALDTAVMTKLPVPADLQFTIEENVPEVGANQTWKTFVWTNNMVPVAPVLQ